MIKKISIKPNYRKDNGLWNLETLSLPLPPDFQVKERNIVYIPSGQFGGNHKHPRREAFVGIGERLFIIWLDDKNVRHEEKMIQGDKLYLFYVEPFTPHVVINRDSSFGLLAELADGPNINVERVEVLSASS